MPASDLLSLLIGIALQIGLIWAGVLIAKAKGHSTALGALAAVFCGPVGLAILALMPSAKSYEPTQLTRLRTEKFLDGTVIELDGTNVTDDDLKCLASNTDVVELRLGGSKITDAGLKYIIGLSKLEVLDLSLTTVGDDGVESLLHVRCLTTLWLGGTWMTDTGFLRLAEIPTLRDVFISNTSITSACLDEFRHRLPCCEVHS